jgi:ABC-2 type transport system ATP-binding protein
LGPNGAGKTTSLKMLVGLLKPNSGTIKINGEDPQDNNKELKLKLGLIPQEIVIWEDLTVFENLMFVASIYKIPKETAKIRVEKLIRDIQLEDKRDSLARNLSGGLKRRLNLIMALVHEPEIIVCDEPTPGLDPQSRTLVWEFIRDLTRVKKKTVILTTHFMEEADRLSDIVAIIDHGKLLVVDTPEKLRNSIGEGDLVEITINNDDLLEESLSRMKNMEKQEYIENVVLRGNVIQVRCMNAPSKLATIFNQIEVIEGLEVIDMKIRKSTLEDVFLHLTGRQLRE